ncbi:MAG: DUF4118 domain-containing protein [Magnetococcus sp. XQGC-1]
MSNPSPPPDWPAREAVLVCVGPGPDSEKLVLRAARRVSQSGAPWHAIAIETPAMQALPAAARARIFGILAMAREIGAETANLSGQDAAAVAIAYARKHHLGTLLVGRDRYRRLPWQHSFAEKIGRLAPDLELLQVARDDGEPGSTLSHLLPQWHNSARQWHPFGLALLVVALVTAGSAPLYAHLDLANIVMIFLLAVVFTAIRLGRGAAVLAAFLSVASFDFFFVPPRFTFAVHDAQYLVTFAVMLTVALLVGQLTAGLKFQASVAGMREAQMRALYEMSRDLSSALRVEQIVSISQRFISQGFRAAVALCVPGEEGPLRQVEGSSLLDEAAFAMARWSFEHGQSAGLGMKTMPTAPLLCIPLRGPTRLCGVLVVLPEVPDWELPLEQRQLLDTSATLIAITLERVHYVILARDAQVNMESERLRNSLLSAISHDLRTPLTVITGLTDAMCMATPPLPEPHAGLAQAIRDEVSRTVTMANNLLDMARMQLGNVALNRSWQTLEEVIGVAMGHCAPILARHSVRIDLPADLPLLEMDSELMARVFNNLIENAAKYTQPGSLIRLSAQQVGDFVQVAVADNGPGLPPGMESRVFEKFTRGKMESTVTGFGLGLAIVRSIVEAHGGMVQAENLPETGARFMLSLPVGDPPTIPEEL